jgi:hypothetical protein
MHHKCATNNEVTKPHGKAGIEENTPLASTEYKE